MGKLAGVPVIPLRSLPSVLAGAKRTSMPISLMSAVRAGQSGIAIFSILLRYGNRGSRFAPAPSTVAAIRRRSPTTPSSGMRLGLCAQLKRLWIRLVMKTVLPERLKPVTASQTGAPPASPPLQTERPAEHAADPHSPLRGAYVPAVSPGASRLRRRVLHHRTHLGTKTCGRIQLDRCCLVIRVHEVEEFAPNFDVYVERLYWPTAPQYPHRGRNCRRRASIPKVVVGERKNNGGELDAPGKLRRWEGYHSPQSRRAATGDLLVDEDGIRT